jgi:hypothetical protein
MVSLWCKILFWGGITMFPISGPFEHFLWKLSEKNLVEGSTVGILVADPRQSQIREFVTNYLDTFNIKSGRYIDFYLPGYIKVNPASNHDITISNTCWKFDVNIYDSFINELCERKFLKFTTTAFLLLLEIGTQKTKFKDFIYISIDSSTINPKQVGTFFTQFFEYAKSEIEFDKVKSWITNFKISQSIRSNLPDIIYGGISTIVKKSVGSIWPAI